MVVSVALDCVADLLRCTPQGAQKLYASSDGWELGMSHAEGNAQFSPLMVGVTAHRVCVLDSRQP